MRTKQLLATGALAPASAAAMAGLVNEFPGAGEGIGNSTQFFYLPK